MTDERFRKELLEDLTGNILPYWLDKMSDPHGGFFGRRDASDSLHPDAPRGAILNARILWTLSAAFRLTGNEEYLRAARDEYEYILAHFIDHTYGGVFWSVNADGSPLDTKKQFYAIAFTIYALSEFYRVSADEKARETALGLFRDIESHSRDSVNDGYREATMRDWSPIADMRLSDKDDNAPKSMNTHLHILEAYTSLLRICDDPQLREAHRNLIRLFLERIEDSGTAHLGLFFADDWTRRDSDISFGHDIEASWLLLEAAQVAADPELLAEVTDHTVCIAMAALDGLKPDGSMIYEAHADGSSDDERHWWVQAECVVGMLYLWKFHDMPQMLDMARQTWAYIRENIVDHENGEWFWSRMPDGSVNTRDDKAGFWKCPYHNSRMHIEALTLLAD